jgi:thioredoxin-like negative regulator of GroEL
MKTVIRYTAQWCGPCKFYTPTFNKVAASTPGVQFKTVDVDSFDETILKYGIRNVPTTILVENGAIVDRHSGVMDETTLKNFIG